jgi:hypothetical protein
MARGRQPNRIPADAERCDKIRKNGERCLNLRYSGSHLCWMHIPPPNRKRAKERATDIEVRQQMHRFAIEPVEDGPEMTGARQLSMELRRAVAWIRFCEAQLQKLPDERAFVYGLVSLETGTDSEEGETGESGSRSERNITKTTNRIVEAARPNAWVELLNWNRVQMTRLVKIWIDAGFEAARLELEIATVDRFFAAINSIVAGLGHDPDDPKVIDVITSAIDRVQELPTLPAA